MTNDVDAVLRAADYGILTGHVTWEFVRVVLVLAAAAGLGILLGLLWKKMTHHA